jgi:predicted RNA-binding Zn-ribbon protein involved in translation (DUF1610 family)
MYYSTMIPRQDWIRQLRRQAFGAFVCAVLLAVTTLTVSTLPWLPVVGVAVASVAVAVHKITSRLHHQHPMCLACGRDLAAEPQGVHGVVCPDCGAIHSGSIRRLAILDEERAGAHALAAHSNQDAADQA